MTLHVTRTGTGPALVLLHGLGVSSWMWDDQVATLSPHFTCVTVDLPGNGASNAHRWESFAATADEIAAVVADVSDDGAAHVVGLSLGGYVTLALLAAHPDRVHSALVSGVTTAPLSPTWLYRPLMRLNVGLMRSPAFVRVSARMMGVPADAQAAMAADGARLAPGTGDRIYDELMDYRTPDLGSAADRLLAVAGDKEVRAVRAGLADLASHPVITTATVPDAHHAWNAEHPELFSRMVRDWALERTLTTGLVGATARR